jgi:uncharacterized membrane protein
MRFLDNGMSLTNIISKAKIFSERVKPETAFAVIAFIFGVFFLLANPPFQAPDEESHFYRAYQVSQGHFIGEKRLHDSGGVLPQGVIDIASLYKTLDQHSSLINFKTAPQNFVLSYSITINQKSNAFTDFRNTVIYAPFLYFPQAIGITVGKVITPHVLWFIYLARFFNLFFSIVLIYFAIKIIPILKWEVFLLGLMPMTLFELSSLSADGLTISLSIFTITLFLYYSLVKKSIKYVDLLVILAVSILLCLAKQAYLPLVFLYFIIPHQKIGSWVKYFFIFFIIFVLILLSLGCWGMMIKDIFMTSAPVQGINPYKQIAFIYSHPCAFVIALVRTYFNNLFFTNSFIGCLSWLDLKLPNFLIESYLSLLILNPLFSEAKETGLSAKQRVWFIFLFVSNAFLISLLLYLTWNSVGATLIDGIQGRYFIPIALLLFSSLQIRSSFGSKISKAKSLVLPSFAIMSLTITFYEILKFFYL